MLRPWIVLLLSGCITDSAPVPNPQRPPAAKAGKQPKQGKNRLPPTARPLEKAPAKALAAAGPVTGTLVLTPPQGTAKKSRAELAMTWEGGSTKAMLGMAPGICVAGEPQPLEDGVALWWATCTQEVDVAAFAVMQLDNALVVRRAKRTDAGLGEWTEVRKLVLAEGAVLQASE